MGIKNFYSIRRKKKNELTRQEQNLLMEKISEAENIDQVAGLFNQLYDSLIYPLWTSFVNKYSQILSKEDLEDLLQDAWVKLLESRKKYNPKNDVYNWVFIIYRNLILDKIREIKRTNEHIIDVFNDDEQENVINILPTEEKSIEMELADKEIADHIRWIIDKIEDNDQKEILKRRIYYDDKVEQISLDLNIPLSTIYNKLKKGISLLRVELEQELN